MQPKNAFVCLTERHAVLLVRGPRQQHHTQKYHQHIILLVYIYVYIYVILYCSWIRTGTNDRPRDRQTERQQVAVPAFIRCSTTARTARILVILLLICYLQVLIVRPPQNTKKAKLTRECHASETNRPHLWKKTCLSCTCIYIVLYIYMYLASPRGPVPRARYGMCSYRVGNG